MVRSNSPSHYCCRTRVRPSIIINWLRVIRFPKDPRAGMGRRCDRPVYTTTAAGHTNFLMGRILLIKAGVVFESAVDVALTHSKTGESVRGNDISESRCGQCKPSERVRSHVSVNSGPTGARRRKSFRHCTNGRITSDCGRN